MTMILILILISALLIGMEAILPGLVLGIAGCCTFLAACGIAVSKYGIMAGFLTFFGGGTLLGVLLFIAYKIFPGTALGKQFILSEEIEGTSNHGIPDSVVGQTCQSVTPLRPTGMVLLGTTRYEAISKDGYIDPDTTLIIKSKDNFRVVVAKLEPAA
jgi:membrane-bound serine protease (ClpP class)